MPSLYRDEHRLEDAQHELPDEGGLHRSPQRATVTAQEDEVHLAEDQRKQQQAVRAVQRIAVGEDLREVTV